MTEQLAPILIVEDSDTSREMLVLLFEKSGYEVVAHSNGDAALADLATQSFSMLLLDQQLPGKSGIELLEADRKYGNNTPAIFVTGSLELKDAVRISHLGIAGIFTKPADPSELMRRTKELVRQTPSQNFESKFELELPEIELAPPAITTGSVPPDPTKVAYLTPRFPAATKLFIEFTHRLWKVRNFRSTLLLSGQPGSPYADFVKDFTACSEFSDGPVLVYPDEPLEADRLLEMMAHALISEFKATVVIRHVDSLDSEGQELLRQVVGFEGRFQSFNHRVRFVLTSDSTLNDQLEDGSFDETLYCRIGSIGVSVPCLQDIADDIVPLARHILETSPRTGSFQGKLQLTKRAANWLRQKSWPGDYYELRRVMLTAAHFTAQREIDEDALANAAELIETGIAPTIAELFAAINAAKTESSAASPSLAPSELPSTDFADETEPDHEETSQPREESSPPKPKGVASYLPQTLTPEELEVAISGTTSPRPSAQTTGKRAIQRKSPGSYDFSKRLSEFLSDTSDSNSP